MERNSVGNGAADWQGQADADTGRTRWRGRQGQGGLTVLKGRWEWRDDGKEGVVAEDKG